MKSSEKAPLRRHYYTAPEGEIHYYCQGEITAEPPLVCLHPLPYSGLFFRTFMELATPARQVLAPDLPGYGGSTPLTDPPTIEAYAKAVSSLIIDLYPDRAVNLMGFHTGCLVGGQIALLQPSNVQHLLLVDVPCFPSSKRQELLESFGQEESLSHEIESLEDQWAFSVGRHRGVVSLERCFELFVEQLKANGRENLGFQAAFNWPVEERLSALSVAALVLATGSSLQEPSRRAAELIPGATFVHRQDIQRSVFEESAGEIAVELERYLNQ